MNSKQSPLILFLAFCLTAVLAQAQTIILWNMNTAAVTSGVPANLAASNLSVGNSNNTFVFTVSGPSTVPGSSAGTLVQVDFAKGLFSAATSTYFEVTLTPTPGYTVTVNSLSFDSSSKSPSKGPPNFSLRSSLDSYTTSLASASTLVNSAWSSVLLTPSTSLVSSIPLTLRFYGFGQTGTGFNNASWDVDDLRINVAVVPEPSSYALLFGGFALVGVVIRRRLAAKR